MPLSPASIHPSLWHAAQLAGPQHACKSSGHVTLDAELPGGGWPSGALVELLCAQPGIGELRLLEPVLSHLPSQRPIVLLCPPYPPNSLCCTGPTDGPGWLWIAPQTPLDAMWAAEQILKNGSCAALLYWQDDIRASTLRRLHLAAQQTDTLFFMLRPARATAQSSPAILRLQLHPAMGGMQIDIVKRRGPTLNRSLFVTLPMPGPQVTPHAPLDRRLPASNRAGRRQSQTHA